MKTRGLHEALKTLSSRFYVRIRRGPLKGYKWILSTGTNFIRGHYEPEKTACIKSVLKPGMIAIDVGAHVGYYSLLMSREVGLKGAVFSYEPRDLNRGFLEKHIRVNGVKNVRVFSSCVGDHESRVTFETRTGTGTGYVSREGNVEVEMTTLDSAVWRGDIPTPHFIKIDVEGAEMRVLQGARKVIESTQPILVLAVHSDSLEKQCRDFLEPMGYTFQDLGQRKGDKEFLVKVAAAAAREAA